MENTYDVDYRTEKPWQVYYGRPRPRGAFAFMFTFLGKSIPLMFEEPDNASTYFSPGDNAAIFLPREDKIDYKALAEKINLAFSDDAEFMKYFEWQKNGLKKSFVRLLFKSNDSVGCRVCEKLDAMGYKAPP